MGRKRKPGTEWMPARVYAGKSAYEFRPKDGSAIRLAPLSASRTVVIRRWHEENTKLERKKDAFSGIVSEFFGSLDFRNLSPGSQKKYQQNAKQVLAVFGKSSCQSIKPQDIRKYMDYRGIKHPVAANREKAFMSRVFSWAYERGKVATNPCKGVRKHTEKARDRYITDAEYQAVYACADKLVQAVMEISFCCAARIEDVLSIKRSQLRDEGLFIKHGKTGKSQIKAWSPRLRAAIDQAKAVQRHPSMERVVANEAG